jgi:hypothetical protein
MRDAVIPSKRNDITSSARYLATYCRACFADFQARRYCPCCLVTYRDEEEEEDTTQRGYWSQMNGFVEQDEDAGNMACCDHCERWIHMRCDNTLTAERLTELEEEGEQYGCPICESRLSKEQQNRLIQNASGESILMPPIHHAFTQSTNSA